MSKRSTSGFTLIELLLASFGLAVIMLSVFTLFSGGVKNWTTMEPQLDMRREATDALYGKAGDKSGGMVGNIQSARLLLSGIDVGATETVYAKELNHGTISSSVIYFINTDKQQVGTNTPPGTFSSTEDDVVCYYAMVDSSTRTYSSWSLKRDVYNPKVGTKSTQVVLRELSKPKETGTGSYRIFTYYDRSGQIINPINPTINKDIAYIKIDIQRDIDTDGDHRWGEDPVDRKNNDGDARIDEDKPMDLSLQTKIFPRMLWKDKPQQ